MPANLTLIGGGNGSRKTPLFAAFLQANGGSFHMRNAEYVIWDKQHHQ